VSATAETAIRRCPVCNDAYPATKKFCRIDGAGLVDVPAEPVVMVPEATQPEIPTGAAAVTEVGSPVKVFAPPTSIEELPTSAALGVSMPEVSPVATAPSIPEHPKAAPTPSPIMPPVISVSPTVTTVAVVEEPPPAPAIQPAPSVVNFQRKSNILMQALVGAGVGFLLLALVGGVVYLKNQRQEPVPPVAVVVKTSPALLEGEINRALRTAGMNEVFSAVDDQFGVLLKGTVPNEALKAKAIEAARSFPQVAKVRDMIFVVEQ